MRIALLLAVVLLTFSCRKESFTSDASALLTTSEDTLHFDTVFTTAGSTTQLFKIRNKNGEGIHIASVRLMGGDASPFKINADGTPGPQISNLDVAAGDSAYVFVTVRIDPTTASLPFVVRDSVEIDYNGNKRKVQLEAYGQNAHFLRNQRITGNEAWNADLPYVVLGGLLVDKGAQLTINKGCKVYMHADAPLLIDGTLQVRGEKWDSTRVVFAGDRIDEPYRDYPAGWPGIVFTQNSTANSIHYATIKNAYQALVLQESGASATPRLTLTQTIIDNAYDAGIIAANTSIAAENVLISNCGKNLVLVKGGHYQFTHCTVASFSNSYVQHKDPVLYVSNFLPQNNVIASSDLTALFRNCIFWGEGSGTVDDEVVVAQNGNTAFNVTFDNTLWKVKNEPANVSATKMINNQSPEFDSINTAKHVYSFRLKETSPAVNTGAQTGVTLDVDGNPRPVGLPDLGAYERQ